MGTQTITGFAPASPTTYTATPPGNTITLTATASSGLPVTFASTSPSICTTSGTNGATPTIVTVGTCTLTANQAGNANFSAATEVTASVTITQATQSISVNYPNSGLVAGGTAQLTATGGGSPNPVTFASTSPTICTVGTSSAGPNATSVVSLNILANGGCQLTANQAGDTQYLPAPEATLTLTIGATGQIYYIHADHLGTPRAITNSVGNGKVWEWKNDDPFGNNAPDENPSGIAGTFKYNLRLPGQYYDQETGTYYNYFRDYDPQTGRYVQSDPIGLLGGLNTYGYVGSNPLFSIDPTGEVALGIGVGIAAGIGVGAIILMSPPGQDAFRKGIKAIQDACTPDDKDPCKGLRDQLRDHERKLREYVANPMSMDNRGFLAGALAKNDQDLYNTIYTSRIASLQKQIANFKKQLEECERNNGR